MNAGPILSGRIVILIGLYGAKVAFLLFFQGQE